MPLAFAIRSDEQIEVRQTFDAPTVYLDHWAIRRFSDDSVLQDRFVRALHEAGGTLLLSHHNFAEFVGPEDPSHAVQAEEFLDRVLPNVYFAELDVSKAILQEQAPSAKGQRLMPPADREMLKVLALQRPAGPQPFTIKGLITEIAKHRVSLGKTFRETNQDMVDTVNRQRRKPEYVKKAKAFKASAERPRTLVVMEELLRGVILDSSMPFSQQDAADYQHAILSISYCDYVLLDGKWQAMVQATERRIEALGLSLVTARCFSERRKGLEEFLAELDSCARDKKFVNDRIRNLEESVRYFSSANKSEREMFVCERFLQALGVREPRKNLAPATVEPPDVEYLDLAFEVKEVLDEGRERHAEYKEALKRARAARSPDDLLGDPINPKPYPLEDSARTVAERALSEARGYAASVRGKIDLLCYVNYMNRFPVPGGAPFDSSVLETSGWRSVSLLNAQFGWVLFASESAPILLRKNQGKPYYRDPNRFPD